MDCWSLFKWYGRGLQWSYINLTNRMHCYQGWIMQYRRHCAWVLQINLEPSERQTNLWKYFIEKKLACTYTFVDPVNQKLIWRLPLFGLGFFVTEQHVHRFFTQIWTKNDLGLSKPSGSLLLKLAERQNCTYAASLWTMWNLQTSTKFTVVNFQYCAIHCIQNPVLKSAMSLAL